MNVLIDVETMQEVPHPATATVHHSVYDQRTKHICRICHLSTFIESERINWFNGHTGHRMVLPVVNMSHLNSTLTTSTATNEESTKVHRGVLFRYILVSTSQRLHCFNMVFSKFVDTFYDVVICCSGRVYRSQ